MGFYMTAYEVEQEHLRVMGAEMGPLFHRLYNECAWLQITWAQYVELFGTKPERIDLLNQAAGLFFRIVQDTLWENTLLSLTRLTDPPESGGKNNLTIRRLPTLLKEADREEKEVERLVSNANDATKFARDWRNRHIAHRDLSLSLGQGAEPLAPASRKQVKEAIDAVCNVIQRVYLIYLHSELRLGVMPPQLDGAESLVYVIRDGVEADEARRKRLLDGKPHPEDLDAPRAV